MKLGAWDTVVAAQLALGLVPEVLDAIDVGPLVGELFPVVDAHVAELGNVEQIIGSEAVGVDHGIGLDALLDDGKKRFRSGIWDDDRVDLPASFEQPEDRHFAGGTTPVFALSVSSEIALVDLDFAAQQLRRFSIQARRNDLSQLMEKQGCGVPVDPHQQGGRTRCCAGDEMLRQILLNTCREPAPAANRNHLIQIAFPCYLGQPQDSNIFDVLKQISAALAYRHDVSLIARLARLAPYVRFLDIRGGRAAASITTG